MAYAAVWPEGTFHLEGEGERHYLGSHWSPFYEDMKDVLCQLPTLLPKSLPVAPAEAPGAPPHALPDAWPKGVGLITQDPEVNVEIVCTVEEGSLQVKSIFPVLTGGARVFAELDEVRVWEGGAEAQVRVGWEECEITFFDTRFLVNRIWYETGKRYEFQLAGLAYDARPARNETLNLGLTADALEKLSMIDGAPDPDQLAALKAVSLKGSAILLPISEWDCDDYHFRGMVKRVIPVGQALGQSGWVARVVVYRTQDHSGDLALDVLITQRAWRGDGGPVEGDEIEGRLWLQGFLAKIKE